MDIITVMPLTMKIDLYFRLCIVVVAKSWLEWLRDIWVRRYMGEDMYTCLGNCSDHSLVDHELLGDSLAS